MNERIRELAEQARKALATDAMSGGEFNMKAYEEKFAELIVEECVKIAHPKLNDVGEWAAGMRLVQKRLKEHFGVE